MLEGLPIASGVLAAAGGLVAGQVPNLLANTPALPSIKIPNPLNQFDLGGLKFELPEINPADILGAVMGEIKIEVKVDDLLSFLPALPNIPLPPFPPNPMSLIPNPLSFLPADLLADFGNPLDGLFGTISPLEAYIKRMMPAIPNPVDGLMPDISKLASVAPTGIPLDLKLPDIPAIPELPSIPEPPSIPELPSLPEIPSIPGITDITGGLL